MNIFDQAKQAKAIYRTIMKLSTEEKNTALLAIAEALIQKQSYILEANAKDLASAKQNGMRGAIVERLTLNEKKMKDMEISLRQIAALEDSTGTIEEMNIRPNGLRIGKKSVPIGVIGIIYESRPNVTVDAFALCFKAGNTVLLRGGKEAFETNNALVTVIQDTLQKNNIPKQAVQLVQDTTRESAVQMMKMNEYLDLLIPRGGASLIQTVVQNSTVPVIETGVGNCHIFIDKEADIEKAISISLNAKVQRPGVCNAVETILVHEDIVKVYLDKMIPIFKEHHVEIRGDEVVQQWEGVIPATEHDYEIEFLDTIIAIKVVSSYEEAINHIAKYGTGHSECIVTENYKRGQNFLNDVDCAAAYLNASTRFTDGFEFGFGAEIGISTQKLHARGPMGLKALTTYKYVIYGDGQIRG